MISLRSFLSMKGMVSFAPGTLTPLWLETGPPFKTVQIMSLSVTSSTRRPIRPSSIRMELPGFTSLTRFLYVIVALSEVPRMSSVVRVNFCPSTSSTFPFSKSQRRISGPRVSSSTATGRCSSRLILRTLSSFRPCSSWSPWEKLNLATFIPDLIISRKISSSWDAGPIVQTIFVLLIHFLLFSSKN